jgi:hypothetical protein
MAYMFLFKDVEKILSTILQIWVPSWIIIKYILVGGTLFDFNNDVVQKLH